MSGIIDAHVHFDSPVRLNFVLQRLTRSREDAVVEGVQHTCETLCAGFTTMRDMSPLPEIIMAV